LASFDEHITHAKSNLDYLSKINTCVNDRWDWQVTTCFYTALHLMNAHIARKANKNYLSHTRVDQALNPYGLSVAKIDEDTYSSYNSLANLSRRSRYLLTENRNQIDSNEDIQRLCLTYSKHFKKAIHHLDKILDFFNKEYGAEFGKTDVKCVDLNGLEFKNFTVKHT
jgi:hypothetical protein